MDIPYIIKFIIAVLLLDFIIYLQHVLFHYLPLLWRMHRMHHSDIFFDVTTGIRFHPFEIIISTIIKIASVMIIGASPFSVIVFEILLNATSMFTHGNISIPLKIDKTLRLFVVTPDMHRVHHSIIPSETNSNFGFNLPIWDRIFGTYRNQPQEGHTGMTIGLHIFRDLKYMKLHWLLIQPFLGTGEK